MQDILRDIVAHKKHEVATAKRLRALEEIRAAAHAAPPPRAFVDALQHGQDARIIAECKRQSPSRGILVPDYDPVRLAQAYAAGGAAAISVLTDEKYFGGTLADLTRVREAVTIPVLRKDFIVDPYQIYEARVAGADSFLLIAGVLDTQEMEALLRVGRELGMEALVESHSAEELEAALQTSARIIGINNRDLKSFRVDLEQARSLVSKVRQGDGPPDRLLVCESGIKSPADVAAMMTIGFRAFLVGEALVTHSDPMAGVRDLRLATP